MPKRMEHTRIIRFVLVGSLATVLHLATTYFAVRSLGTSIGAANGLAFLTATGVSYVLQQIWTFSEQLSLPKLRRFLLASLFCASVAALVSGGMSAFGGSSMLATLAVLAVVPPLSYLVHRFWTFA